MADRIPMPVFVVGKGVTRGEELDESTAFAEPLKQLTKRRRWQGYFAYGWMISVCY